MKLLLDTHCWLWMQVSPSKISQTTRTHLTDSSNTLYLSAASSWEIAIKWALGKLPLPEDPRQYVPRSMERQNVLGLPIQHRHVLRTAHIPSHHRDPFDRLLVAQAQLEELTLVTADAKLLAYKNEVDLLKA